jgi:hypothetical protein
MTRECIEDELELDWGVVWRGVEWIGRELRRELRCKLGFISELRAGGIG